MALHEGCRRLRLAGKVLVVTGLAIAVVAAILLCFADGFRLIRAGDLVPPVFALVFLTEISGATLWFLGWVLEGFARPQPENSDEVR